MAPNAVRQTSRFLLLVLAVTCLRGHPQQASSWVRGTHVVALDDFGNSFFVQMKVVEYLDQKDQKAESLLIDLMECLVA